MIGIKKTGRTSKKLPLVSAIVTTVNRRNDLRECLDSLLAQDYPRNRFEIVVICDPSSDGSEEMLEKEYGKNKNILVIINKQRTKLTEARNIAIRRSKGEILVLCSDDIIYYSDTFKKFVKSFEESPEVSNIGGQQERIGNEVICKFQNLYEDLSYPLQKMRGKQYLVGGEELKRVNGADIAAVKREVFEKTGLYDESFDWGGEDVELRKRILENGFLLKHDPRIRCKAKVRANLQQFAKREYRLGKGAADWDFRFPELVSLKHKAGLALFWVFSITGIYAVASSILGLPGGYFSSLACTLVFFGAIAFFSLDSIRFAIFRKSAPLSERAWFFLLRLIQNASTYLGYLKRNYFEDGPKVKIESKIPKLVH
jgi:glycosyltransferase involved in cell wall biosynthesis